MKLKLAIFTGVTTLFCGCAAAQTATEVPVPASPAFEGDNWDRNFTFSEKLAFDPTGSIIEERAQSYQFGGSGRWQMNLQTVTRSEESPLPREEMRAGATYQFTPRFSLGGTVSVGAEELDDRSNWEEQKVEAGVRLKTTFKF